MKPEDIAPQKVDRPDFDNRPSVAKKDERSNEQMIADAVNSINKVLVRDPNGTIKAKEPDFRDPEPPHKMLYKTVSYKEIEVPHEEVIFYTHGVIMDRNTSHSATVVIGNERRGHVFDRSYTWEGKTYHRCAWIPNRVERAGIMFYKMIHQRIRRAVAVLRKYPNTNDPMYLIVGGQEADYRDLKRIFERNWINRLAQMDDELDRFKYESIPAIPEELTE